jgi:hypothetical protein
VARGGKVMAACSTRQLSTCIRQRGGMCLEPEGNGVNPGGGNEGGPGPPSGEQDKQLTASRGGDNSLIEQEKDGKKGQA